MPSRLDEVASLIRSGQIEKAEATLGSVTPTDEDRAEHLYWTGRVFEERHQWVDATTFYEQVLDIVPDHTESCFRLAYLCDLRGEDDRAIELYEVCTSSPPAPVNALLNLSVLYEEHDRASDALDCVRRVLDEYPEHRRARLFFKDVEGTLHMNYEDEDLRRGHEHDFFDTPISDFELSVRSRNCLKQMEIHTLGDLLRTTEAELLSYKNFGETSLNEIREMLTQRGLAIGQAVEQLSTAGVFGAPAPDAPALGDPALLNRPVSEMELSVRSRRCLQRQGIATLGELVTKSEAELLATKNFGQTSLDEIKIQLAERGLSLRMSK